jgi:hypothetical protein
MDRYEQCRITEAYPRMPAPPKNTNKRHPGDSQEGCWWTMNYVIIGGNVLVNLGSDRGVDEEALRAPVRVSLNTQQPRSLFFASMPHLIFV